MAPISGSSSPTPGISFSTSSAPPSVSPLGKLPAQIFPEIAQNADRRTTTNLAYAGMGNSTMRHILGRTIKQKGLPADLMDRIPQTDLDQLREHLLVPDAPARGAPLGIEHLNRTGKEALARSVYATGDLLAELYEHSGEDIASKDNILEGLGANPNTPEDILDQLASPGSSMRVFALAARNRSTAAETLDRLAGDPNSWVRAQAARNESMAADTLNQLASDADPVVREAAADNRSTAADTLDRLASDPDSEVRRNVAGNGSTTADTLDRLAGDPDRWVRMAAARNGCTAADTLNRLAGDPDALVRRTAARNENMAADTLNRLAGDPDALVREKVARNECTAADTVNRLAGDPDPSVRQAAARNGSTSAETLNRLAGDPDSGVRKAAAHTLNRLPRRPPMEKAVVQLLLFSRSQADGS